MDWATFNDYLYYVFLIIFFFFIFWSVFVSRRYQKTYTSALDISHESIELARRAVELSEKQLDETRKTNQLLQELAAVMKKEETIK